MTKTRTLSNPHRSGSRRQVTHTMLRGAKGVTIEAIRDRAGWPGSRPSEFHLRNIAAWAGARLVVEEGKKGLLYRIV